MSMIGRRIKNIRISLGLTMKEFGEKFNPPASDSIVSRRERGISVPNNARLKRIAELGNISIEELLDGSEKPKNNVLGEEIRRLREEKGLSVRRVAKLTGVSNAYLSQIENGRSGAKKPSPEILSNLANLFDVSKLYLYKCAGYLDETDILELIDENKRLREESEQLLSLVNGLAKSAGYILLTEKND